MNSMFSASASPAGSKGICKPMEELRRCRGAHFMGLGVFNGYCSVMAHDLKA